MPSQASAVSTMRFLAVRELPTFPRVSLARPSLVGKFLTFGSGLMALRRQSLLVIFQFPFRQCLRSVRYGTETGLRIGDLDRKVHRSAS
jgi:hypothetical protein